MDKHAYLILAHVNPGQLKKLLSSLDDPRNDIFVHIDARASFGPDELKGSCSSSGLYFTDRRIKVKWGGVSIMRAEIELLKKSTAVASYSYYHLLSGMDMPVKSQDTIHSFFDKNAGKEFLHFWKMPEHTKMRVQYFTLFPEGARTFYTNIPNGLVKGLLKGLGLKMNRDVDFRFGSQWFSITDSLARYVVSREDWLEKVFRHTCMIDEIFLATLVWNSDFRSRLYIAEESDSNKDTDCMANLRFIDWTRGASIRHPWTFTAGDYDLLCSVPHFWARKFDERVDSVIIDRMLAHVKL